MVSPPGRMPLPILQRVLSHRVDTLTYPLRSELAGETGASGGPVRIQSTYSDDGFSSLQLLAARMNSFSTVALGLGGWGGVLLGSAEFGVVFLGGGSQFCMSTLVLGVVEESAAELPASKSTTGEAYFREEVLGRWSPLHRLCAFWLSFCAVLVCRDEG